ncbi:MAG: SpoIIIAH-like family protein [Firmicutes bacterium]|nr:SpoIIIAH-like family protein [Bacillota bacterium]
MDNEATRKLTTIVLLVLAVAAIWYAKQFQDDRIDIVSPQNPIEGVEGVEDPVEGGESADPTDEEDPTAPTVADPDPENWDLENEEAFFVEYRLQRERMRASEVEMLNGMIANDNITAEGKKQAEEQLLELIELMEKELMVENMLKAQGYNDAVFFYKDGRVNVVVQASKLDESQFMQIADMIGSVTGVSIDNISVVEHGAS